MKKINLKGISEVLSDKELKNVMGGSGYHFCDGKRSCSSHSDCGSSYCATSQGRKCCI